MSDKIKISEEKHFFDYLKSISPIHGCFGRTYIDKESEVRNSNYVILDENLKVIFEHEPFGYGGNYHENVIAKLNELKLDKHRGRGDNSIESLLVNIEVSSSLNWYALSEKENIEIEPSSDEFIEFCRVCDCMHDVKIEDSPSRLDRMPIEYEGYTELGKKNLDKKVEWFKSNTSITPVQDAWFNLLRKNGVVVDWEPFIFDETKPPVMKDITYASKEECDAIRKARKDEIYHNIDPEFKTQLRQLYNRLKK